MTKLQQVKQANPGWFSRKNKRIFGDQSYRVLLNKDKQPFLVRSTYAWSDMFGREPWLHFRINPLGADLKILPLLEKSFPSLLAVKYFLKYGF